MYPTGGGIEQDEIVLVDGEPRWLVLNDWLNWCEGGVSVMDGSARDDARWLVTNDCPLRDCVGVRVLFDSLMARWSSSAGEVGE